MDEPELIKQQERHRVNEVLLAAIRKCDAKAVQECLDAGADIETADNGRSAVAYAIKRLASVDVCDTLMHQVARPHVHEKGAAPLTPLMLSVKFGHRELVESLLHKGVDPNAVGCDQTMQTPLHVAAAQGDTTTVSMLLESGAMIDAQDANGNTPAHLATDQSHIGTVEFLINSGCDLEIRREDSKTPYNIARRHGENAMVRMIEHVGKRPSDRSR